MAEPRTQEQRSASTKEKVINAAIGCIYEEGLSSTTVARIATRSGVTWGAIAHHFGDKDSILFAVLERNAEIFYKRVDKSLARAGPSLREHVSALIDVTWIYLNEPGGFSFIELVIHNRASTNEKILAQQENLSITQMENVWNKVFGEFNISATTLRIARDLAMSSLMGLAVQRLIRRRKAAFKEEIAALKMCTAQMLEANGKNPPLILV